MDKGDWVLIIHSTTRSLLPSHYLQGQPQALDHSDALCHLIYQMEIVPDHRVLVKIKSAQPEVKYPVNDSDDDNNDEILPSFRISLIYFASLRSHHIPPCSLQSGCHDCHCSSTFSFMLDLSTCWSFYPPLPHFIKQTSVSFKRILLGITICEILADSAKQV